MNPLVFLKGETLGKTIYNVLVLLAALALAGYLAFGMIGTKFWHWRADKANDRADRAEAVAETRTREAESADKGAANASITRDNMDRGKLEITVRTEQAAEKYDNATTTVSDDGGIDPDLLRDVEAARNRAGAAADRLRRTSPGRSSP